MARRFPTTTTFEGGTNNGVLYEFTVTVAQATISIPTAGFPSGPLLVDFSAKSTGASPGADIRFNGVSTATYTSAYSSWSATNVAAGTTADGALKTQMRGISVSVSTIGNFSSQIIEVLSWDDSDRYTQVLARGLNVTATPSTDANTQLTTMMGQWQNNAVVTSIDLVAPVATWDVDSRVRVYAA